MSSQIYRKRKLSNQFEEKDKILIKEQNSIDIYDENQNSSKVILKLNWNTRVLAINCLNEFPNLIDGKIKLTKEKFSENLDQLVQDLFNLPIKDLDDLNIQSKKKKKINKDENKTTVLEIDAGLRLKLIDLLIYNKNFFITYLNSISEEKKSNLIKENRKMVNILLDLPYFIDQLAVNDSTGIVLTSSSSNNSSSIINTTTESEDVYYNKKASEQIKNAEIIKLDKEMMVKINEFESNIENVKFNLSLNKFDCKSLKQMVEDMRKNVDRLINHELNRSEALFTFHLEDIKNFSKSFNSKFSDCFKCAGSEWYLYSHCQLRKADNENEVQSRYIDFDLFIKNDLDKKFKCQAKLEFKLITHYSGIQNRTMNCDHLFTNDSKSIGTFKFIKVDDLLDKSNGFVKNDAITIQCLLKADRLLEIV